MLAKKASDRISIAKMKKHPFFKEIDFDMLYNKMITPPVILTMDCEDGVEELKDAEVDDEEAKFLNFGGEVTQNSKSASANLMDDNDYEAHNSTMNRVK